jgi:hypothetical protein
MPIYCSFIYLPAPKQGDASNFYDRKNPRNKKGGK